MAAELTQLLEDIKGDWQGRVRITVNETSGNDQLGLLWAYRCRHYSADATAALAYEAEDLEPLDSAASAVLAGASGGDVVAHTNLSTAWTPVVGTNIGGTTWLTHTGSYQAWARVRSVDGGAVQLRFAYDVGDLTLPEENAPWEFPGASNFYLADLGQIRLDEVPVGVHRWQGQIQAKGTVGGEDVQIDRLYFQPLDEGAGKLVAPPSAPSGFVDYVARDEFNQTAGNLDTKVAPVGGTWADTSSADFSVNATSHMVERTGGAAGGNSAYLSGVSLTDVAVQADVKFSAPGGSIQAGLLGRRVNSTNYVQLYLDAGSSTFTLTLSKTIAGAGSILGTYLFTGAIGQFYELRLVILGSRVLGFLDGVLRIAVSDTQVQALSAGSAGIIHGEGTDSQTRTFDNFSAFVPTYDAVIFANQAAELRTEGIVREDATGTAYGPVAQVTGDLPRLPPSGMEGRPCELFIITSRGDFDQLPDSAIDTVAQTGGYQPSFLFAPSA